MLQSRGVEAMGGGSTVAQAANNALLTNATERKAPWRTT
jgi:hypothetical protein